MKHQVQARRTAIMNHHVKARRVLLVSLLSLACGCAGSPMSNLRLPGSRMSQAQPASTTGRVAMSGTRQAQAANVAQGSSQSLATKSPQTNRPISSAVVPVSHEEPLYSSGEVAEQDPSCAPGASSCLSDGACVTEGTDCGPVYPPVPQYWNDQEYLYDGGDREPKVQVTDNWEVKGLDSQDTVAHYETVEGNLCITPSNRVPIYAPRFGAVRKMTAPTIAAKAVGATPLVEPLGASIKSTHEPASDVASPVGPKKREVVKLIDGLHDRTRGVAAEKIMPAHDLSSYQMALNRLQNHTTSLRREDLLAILGEYMVNARTWVSPEGVAVAMNGVKAAQTRDAKEVQDVTVYEDEPGKCSLRICKAASHSAASPGDIIHFSIRFDNIGNKPIGNLVILDSLVTRLEYIDGSQQCLLSLASNKTPDKELNAVKFSTSENEAGSTVLRWEADLPLEAGDSGVITFRCRVR